MSKIFVWKHIFEVLLNISGNLVVFQDIIHFKPVEISYYFHM